jgi:FAD-dependent oxidoreductase domain-containing protein 1
MTSVPRSKFDTVIVGGGVVGLSSAYHLAAKLGAGDSICVLERDNTYARCSATLSAGGIRQQFSGTENIAMSQYGYTFLSNPEALRPSPSSEPVDFQFCEGGYMFLASESGRATLEENHRTQTQAGHAGVLLLDPPAISARFPWLSMDGVAAGSLGIKHEGCAWARATRARARVCAKYASAAGSIRGR